MSTRHQKTDGPISQERYMSSNEFAELRGISGIAVSARAAVLLNSRKRNFLWWLQGQSLAEGGLKRVARELVAMFPDRLGTPAMHKAGVVPEKMYAGELVISVEMDLELREALLKDQPTEAKKGLELVQHCRAAALFHREKNRSPYRLQSLEEFIVDLCINPRLHFRAPGEEIDVDDIESDRAIEENPELSKYDFKQANLVYFRDVVGALFEYQERTEAKVRENFQLTAIGKQIWETLNYALASRGMVVVDGLEGRGKTEAVKSWCAIHMGTARFVSLKGITNKTTAFREIAKALGIASSYAHKSTQMQARIEDVLARSKIGLIIDEAHFVFNQGRRINTRPELVDWIDTAVCNRGVPVCLCTTPQFIVCMTRAADQVDWNYRQFRRRVKRWIKLPAANSEDDIKAVARKVFTNSDAQMVSLIAGYALLSKRDLSAVGDVADEVRSMLGSDDLSKATARHIHRAIHEHLLPSDQTFLEGMAAARSLVKKPGPKRATTLPAPEPTEPMDEAPDAEAQPDALPTRGVMPSLAISSRSRAGNAAESVPA